jgi:hypothetical protein
MIAADWGWAADEIARRLIEESPKARENGVTYAQQTAERGAEAAARNARAKGHKARSRDFG